MGKFRIENASESDIPEILALIEKNKFRKNGTGFLLQVSESSLKRLVAKGNFFAALSGKSLAGCASVAEHNGIAELRTLVVKDKYRGSGMGSALIEKCKQKALEKGYDKIYVLTKFRNCKFLKRHGFRRIGKPIEKMWKDCMKCPLHKKGCNEVAMVCELK